jgi:two-component system, sensor histidine kinase
MLPLSSIRLKVIVIIAVLMVIPVLVLGVAGLLYYQHAVKENIDSENLGQAKAIAALTENYVDLSQNYLGSIADRPLVGSAIETGDLTYLNVSASYAAIEGREFQSVFATDASGKVLSYRSMFSEYPYAGEVGKNYSEMPVVNSVLKTGSQYVSDGMKDHLDGKTTVYIGVPITKNNTTIGALVGAMDLRNLTSVIARTQRNNKQYAALVNRSGNVMLHSNQSYMWNMTDASSLLATQNVLKGQEGVVEQPYPFENDVRLAAYTPITKYGWGVIISIPREVAYQPITEFTGYLLVFLVALLFIAIILSIIFGDYITRPLLRISDATAKIPAASVNDLERELPLGRRDEMGGVARSILAMAKKIGLDRERLISAKESMEKEKERADDEKHRTELYVDIMGHDINNLNQLTLGYLEMIKDNSNLTDEQRGMITEALNASRGSSNIIDNVRKIQRISEEKRALQREEINDMILECIRDAPKRDDIKITINYAPRKGLMIMGTALMKEVFCNLINNAIKHASCDVVVDVRVDEVMRSEKKFYEVSVTDNGHGISDDLKSRLFNRFQRGETKAYGKGLGLFIVKSLVEQAGGDVKVEDRVPGDYTKGAKFIVSLPVCEECK